MPRKITKAIKLICMAGSIASNVAIIQNNLTLAYIPSHVFIRFTENFGTLINFIHL